MSRPVITAAPGGTLTMEEVKFWLEIMREHALFIKLGLPCDNTALINEAEGFYKDFGTLLKRTGRINDERQFVKFITDSMDVVTEFLRFKRHLVHQMLVCRISGNNPPLMIDHMAREAEYVLAIFGRIKDQAKNPHLSKTRENVFWLRIMTDHTKFIAGRLDPSERAIINTVEDFSHEFDDLFLEANDFYSMLTHPSQLPLPAVGKKAKKLGYNMLPHLKPPVYERFVRDVRTSVLRLRDFKKALYKMTEECRVASIIPPLLADHVRREADHFLMILAMMEKGMIDTCGDFIEPLEGLNDDSCLGVVGSNLATAAEAIQSPLDIDCDDDDDEDDDLAMPEVLAAVDMDDDEDDDCDYADDCDDDDDADEYCDDECDDDDDWEDDDDFPVVKPKYSPKFMEGVREPESVPEPKAASAPVSKQSKPAPVTIPEPTAQPEKQVKWSGKWPRPLGKINK